MTRAAPAVLFALCASASLPSAVRGQAAPPTRGELPAYTIDRFMETVRITTASLSADGEAVLFTSDASGVPNAWTVPFAGGDPVQLTRSTNSNDVPVEYIVFPDEGHGFLKKDNQRRAYEAVLAFLDEHLYGGGNR